jgi:hypothetical protein
MLLGAVSNALDVQFIPDRIRDWWQTGIRDRLWSGRAGEWLARRLGAPEQSRTVGGGAFRATEAALGLAAGELFAALPQPYRERLVELPATVAALEARAVAARAEIDMLAALAPSGSRDADVLATRRAAAAAHLAAERRGAGGIRLDLLRLHAERERPGPAHDADRRRAPARRGRRPARRGPARGGRRHRAPRARAGTDPDARLTPYVDGPAVRPAWTPTCRHRTLGARPVGRRAGPAGRRQRGSAAPDGGAAAFKAPPAGARDAQHPHLARRPGLADRLRDRVRPRAPDTVPRGRPAAGALPGGRAPRHRGRSVGDPC